MPPASAATFAIALDVMIAGRKLEAFRPTDWATTTNLSNWWSAPATAPAACNDW